MTLLPMPFPNPRTYAGHSGVDFPQPAGTPYRASAGGVVVGQGYSPVTGTNPRAGGYWVTVRYDNGVQVFGCHFRNLQGVPRNGTRLEYGQFIASVGSTGFSDGPHLHAAIDGQPGTAAFWKYFDPNRYVGDGSGSGGGGVVTPTVREGLPMERFLFNSVEFPDSFYMGTYVDGNVFKARPVLGVELRALKAIDTRILPRVQLFASEVVELCRQGGYVAPGK